MSKSSDPLPHTVQRQDALGQTVRGEATQKGGILKSFLASALIGSELDMTRPVEKGRKFDL